MLTASGSSQHNLYDIYLLLQAVSITCMTYTCCCVYSSRLLMMDKETVRKCRVLFQK